MTYRGKLRFNTQRYTIFGVFVFNAVLMFFVYPKIVFLLAGVVFVLLLELEYRERKSFAILNKQGFLVEKHYLFGLIKGISTTSINNPEVLDLGVHHGTFTFKDLNEQMNCTIKFKKAKD